MSITPWTIYLITRVDSLLFMSVLACIASIILGIILIFVSAERLIEEATAKKAAKLLVTIFITSLLTVLLVPSKQDIAAMIVVPRIANNESLKELGEGIVDLAKDWLKELKPAKEVK